MKRYGILALICILLLGSLAACKGRETQGTETDGTVSGVQTDEFGNTVAPDESRDPESDGSGDADEDTVADRPGDLAQGEWDPQP